VLMDGQPPVMATLVKLAFAAVMSLAIGFIMFETLKKRFYEYL
jgi:hypothetical protein